MEGLEQLDGLSPCEQSAYNCHKPLETTGDLKYCIFVARSSLIYLHGDVNIYSKNQKNAVNDIFIPVYSRYQSLELCWQSCPSWAA